MRYTRRNIEGGVVALRESDNTNFLKSNGQSRNLNIYDLPTCVLAIRSHQQSLTPTGSILPCQRYEAVVPTVTALLFNCCLLQLF